MSAKVFAPEVVSPLWEERKGEDRLAIFFARMRRNKALAASIVVLSLAGATALALLLPSYWRVEIEIMPVTHSNSLSLGSLAAGLGGAALGGSGLSSLLSAPSSTEDEALAVLRSRELFDSYATQNNLLPVLYANDWDAAHKRWIVSPSRAPTLRRAYRLFDREIRDIDLDRRSGIVTLSITWTDRVMAVQWACDLIDLTNRKLRDQAISDAKSNMSYLSQEMRNVRDVSAQNALTSALASAYERQLQDYMFAQGQKDFAFRVIDPPTVPDVRERVSPQRALIVAIGFFAGLLLALGAVQIREFWRRRRIPRPSRPISIHE